MKQKSKQCLLAILLLALLSGCGEASSPQPSENSGKNNSEETQQEEQQETVAYAYEDELNIMDDNYRNYYEIFVGSFYDSDGDGMGDLQGVIEKLDYINDGDNSTDTDLGFNGIWLMPIMPSDTYHKYDVKDYYDIDPEYGTMEDMEQLIEECHSRDINIIIDLVFNHTSTKHQWFVDATQYLSTLPEGADPNPEECKYVNYYNFARDKGGVSTWHQVGTTEWYYECVFWDQMPDLNLDDENVRAEIEGVADFWLEKGVDGFRLDAAKEYFSGNAEKNVEVLSWFCNHVKSVNSDAYVVAEVWENSTIIAKYYASGITSLFNFPMSQYNGRIVSTAKGLQSESGKDFAESVESITEKYKAQNPEFIDAPFISNHDTSRVGAQVNYDENQVKYAAGLLMTESGSPFVYYGEEIGMTSSGTKDENKRLAMYWSNTDTEGMTKDPVGADKVEQKFAPVDEQIEDPLSIYNYYKRALRIRNENPEIARGDVEAISGIEIENICAMRKTWNDTELIIVYNSGTEEKEVSFADLGITKGAICDYLTVDGSEVTLDGEDLQMPPYSIVFLK